MSDPLLSIEDLRVEFAVRGRRSPVVAVDGVDLHIGPGETLGLVGESGSGKSTLGNAVLGLAPVTAGRILFGGQDITHATWKRRRMAARGLQVVFQDPYHSLNPARAIGQTLAEPLVVRRELPRARITQKVEDALEQVGLPAEARRRYPAQFSGGQRQRIAIARALVLDPDLVICDEPTSALDLSVQAQVLNLLLDLQDRLGLAYLFISHDIDVVRHVSHRVAVFRAGQVVEEGPTEVVTSRPDHPYTKALLAAVPNPTNAAASA